jgi:excisionase family DNA binding protein
MTTTAARIWLTSAEVAKQIRRNEQTIRRYRREGLLKGHRVNGAQYLYDQADVDAFLNGDTVASAPEPKPLRSPKYTK